MNAYHEAVDGRACDLTRSTRYPAYYFPAIPSESFAHTVPEVEIELAVFDAVDSLKRDR